MVIFFASSFQWSRLAHRWPCVTHCGSLRLRRDGAATVEHAHGRGRSTGVKRGFGRNGGSYRTPGTRSTRCDTWEESLRSSGSSPAPSFALQSVPPIHPLLYRLLVTEFAGLIPATA